MRVMQDTTQGSGDIDRRVERLVDDHMVAPTAAPRGRKGLWGALALTVTPRISERALPLTDTSAVGATTSMFDYDPALADALDLG